MTIKRTLNALQIADDSVIINNTHIQEQIEMLKKQEIINNHKYSIWQGKNGKWYTYLFDEDGKKKLVKKSTKEKIHDEVVRYYTESRIKRAFIDVFHEWREYHDKTVSDNTIVKYDTEEKRMFNGTEFSKMLIESITEDDINLFIISAVKDQGMCKKTCKTLFGFISNTFKFAMRHKYIIEDPTKYLAAKEFYHYCVQSKRSQKEQTISDTDLEKLDEMFASEIEKHPGYIPNYAVKLAALTGMRVGELSALSWDCIFEDYILINKSEKYNRKTKMRFIDTTKNGKERKFPLTDDISNLLNKVKNVEIENNNLCEWVFADENGRVSASRISSCLKNKCRMAGINEKGIHAYRKTVNSKLKCNGVPSVIAASLLGHTKDVNEQYYTFDITSLTYKATLIAQINAQMIKGNAM